MKEYELLAIKNQQRANEILIELNLVEFFNNKGCKVNIIGSLAMGLLVKHRDIDLHIYSSQLSEEKSFAIISQLAKNSKIKEIRCINGLSTEEHCIEWHLKYEDIEGEIWQIDIIHIELGTKYDGLFELMAEKINTILSNEQRQTIMRLKYETPEDEEIHGIEYYQAVIEDNIKTIGELRDWIKKRRESTYNYWIP